MNKADRQARRFDQAAEQARCEGVGSFGRMTGRGWTPKAIAEFTAAANARGVRFEIDQGDVGYFVAD